MSSVMDTIICAQCGFGEADLIFELDKKYIERKKIL